jgi:predicted permease
LGANDADRGAVPVAGVAVVKRLRGLLRRLRGVVFKSRRERELAEELESHFQLHIDDNIRAGMSDAEARRAAILSFGPIESIKEQYRDRSTIPFVEAFVQDVQDALRSLRRHRGFAFLSIATLAVGVGATASMAGLVDALMLRPLPFVRQPERVVNIDEIGNYKRYLKIGSRVRMLDLAGYTRSTLSLGAGPDAVAVTVECVTPNYFSLLGAAPVLGRAFAADDEERAAEPVAVIGHGLWTRRFGADAGVLGQHVGIAGRQYTIVGVAPPRFRGVRAEAVDAWILLSRHLHACTFGAVDLMSSNGFWLRTIGRVRDGATLQQAAAEAVAVDTDPETLQRQRADGTTETILIDRPPQLVPVRPSRLVPSSSDDRLALWLTGGAAVLLLIACANVGSLLAMRAVERRREIAIRLQLGASRQRVFAQLLTESLVIAALCGIAAVLIAGWMGALLRAFYSSAEVADLLTARTGGIVAGFAVLAGLLSGTIPAIQAARADISSHLRTGRAVHERQRLRSVVLMAQVALALLLVMGAGLFVRSLRNFRGDLGYDLNRVLAASADLQKAGYRDSADARARYGLMLARVRQLPEVEFAALSTNQVLGERGGSVTSIARRPDEPDWGCCHAMVTVTPGFFETLGIRIIRGRNFTDADTRPSGLPAVILDEDLARKMFASEEPIGQCVMIRFDKTCHQVVGIAESGRRGPLRRSQIDSEFFLPFVQASTDATVVPQTLIVRPRTMSRTGVAAISAAIRSAAPDLPYVDVQPLADLADVEASSWRMGATLFGLFGTLAVALAAVGIYGALAFSMRQRTPEIGVRLAFGAEPYDIAAMVIRQALFVTGVGWLVGTAAAFVLMKYIESLLLDVAPRDLPTFASASIVILVAALGGALIPALRSARVDPAAALRME